MDEVDVFIPPPEAPVFTPSESEFSDPISYIAKIVKPVIEKSGICKIRPPEHWQPPFAVDVESFKFQPRVQNINELEATTRVKLNFLRKLFKFWELQGVTLKVPSVNRKPLDMHKLHKVVQEEGGYGMVTDRHRWSHIATKKMNIPDCYASTLKSHYAKYLYPYDLFEAGVTYDSRATQKALAKHPSSQAKSTKKEPDVNCSFNSEMKKLQFHGAGRKTALPSIKPEEGGECDRTMRGRTKASYLESDICRICTLTENEREMLTCSNCDEVYHKYCLFPKVDESVEGQWRCPRCVAKEYKKPTEVFGFDTSTELHSLASFGAMADQFKENHFRKPISKVSCAEVEEEFWRLTSNIDKSVTVQYGADIHALTNGSGFPTEITDDLRSEDEKYIHSKWNLNNLPVDERSVLRYVSGDVSGMKVPWCYVGMCFSSFCWHIEDHWSYSINYHHWGEPKTWYGVPSSHAEALEDVMRSGAPELFEQSPDLLHHITTIMNPNILMSHNIPVVRTDQCAGEFIVTAPRAFHAGFNQGYNFAEAVNFCPADWLPMGQACISNYKKVKRHCVFSHEELVCKMAAEAENLNLQVALEAHKELLVIVDQERRLRKKLKEYGVTMAERVKFELKADDERQCSYCKTTCFLSAIVCPCRPNNVACIEHIVQLCNCPGSKKCLLYRYTLDELPAMIRALSGRLTQYNKWKTTTRRALNARGTARITMSELKSLLTDGRENSYFQHTSLYSSLQQAVKEAEKYLCLVKETVNRRTRSRRNTDLAVKSAAKRLTLSDISTLSQQLQTLSCQVKDADLLQELADKATQFKEDVKAALPQEPLQRKTLEDLYEVGLSLDIDMDEVGELERAIEQRKWLDEVTEALDRGEDDLLSVEELQSLVARGNALVPHPDVDKVLTEVDQILKVGQSWEEKASICLNAMPKHTLSTIEALLLESEGVKVYLENIETLREQTQRSMEWIAKAESMLKSLPHPELEHLKSHAGKAKFLPVKLDTLADVHSVLDKADGWKQTACRHFVKARSDAKLLELLFPRYASLTPPKRHQHKKPLKQREENNIDNDKLIDNLFATQDMYKKAAEAELAAVLDVRKTNELTRQCWCGGESVDKMVQCVLCLQCQHYQCFGLSRNQREQGEVDGVLCSSCTRSKRPRLQIILQLLVSLQKIPARFIEGEAVQCLTERALKWQDRARSFINSNKYVSLLKKFNLLKSKNQYWADQAETEEEQVESSMLVDHDYSVSPSKSLPVKKVHPVFDIPTIEPDEEFIDELNSVLLEGRLIEVSIEELSQLAHFKYTLQMYKLNGLAVTPKLRPRQKSVQSNGCTQEAVISSTTSAVEKLSRKRKSRSGTGSRRKQKFPADLSNGSIKDDLWGDYDEHCAAANGCLRPDDESICWVQCGSCELWFHFTCIGLHSKQLPDEDYLCQICTQRSTLQQSEDGKQSIDLSSRDGKQSIDLSSEDSKQSIDLPSEDSKQSIDLPSEDSKQSIDLPSRDKEQSMELVCEGMQQNIRLEYVETETADYIECETVTFV